MHRYSQCSGSLAVSAIDGQQSQLSIICSDVSSFGQYEVDGFYLTQTSAKHMSESRIDSTFREDTVESNKANLSLVVPVPFTHQH